MATKRRPVRNRAVPPPPEQEAFLSIVRTADDLLFEAAQLLRTRELSPPLYNVLRILRGAGAEGLRCGQSAERRLNRGPDVTRLLDRLATQGLVGRTRSEKYRRAVVEICCAGGPALLTSRG